MLPPQTKLVKVACQAIDPSTVDDVITRYNKPSKKREACPSHARFSPLSRGNHPWVLHLLFTVN